MADVLGGVTYILAAWEDCVREEMPNTAVLYDDGLSYETAMKLFRDNNNNNLNTLDPLPMLAYKRTVAKPIEDHLLGKRADSKKACIRNANGELVRYNISYVEFDLLFAYFTKDVELQERFEIAYTNGTGISELETFQASYPEIGDVTYSMKWQELEEFTIQEDEANHFKSIIGSAKVRGFLFSFADKPQGEIRSIDARFVSSPNLAEEDLDELLSECIIEEDN
jgi:hypothetical protein